MMAAQPLFNSTLAMIFGQLVEIKEASLERFVPMRDALDAGLAGAGVPRSLVTSIRSLSRVRINHINAVVARRQAYLDGLNGSDDLLTPALVAGLAFEYEQPGMTAQQVGVFIANLLAQWTAVRDTCDAVLPTPPFAVTEVVLPDPAGPYQDSPILVDAGPNPQALLGACDAVIATLAG